MLYDWHRMSRIVLIVLWFTNIRVPGIICGGALTGWMNLPTCHVDMMFVNLWTVYISLYQFQTVPFFMPKERETWYSKCTRYAKPVQNVVLVVREGKNFTKSVWVCSNSLSVSYGSTYYYSSRNGRVVLNGWDRTVQNDSSTSTWYMVHCNRYQVQVPGTRWDILRHTRFIATWQNVSETKLNTAKRIMQSFSIAAISWIVKN